MLVDFMQFEFFFIPPCLATNSRSEDIEQLYGKCSLNSLLAV